MRRRIRAAERHLARVDPVLDRLIRQVVRENSDFDLEIDLAWMCEGASCLRTVELKKAKQTYIFAMDALAVPTGNSVVSDWARGQIGFFEMLGSLTFGQWTDPNIRWGEISFNEWEVPLWPMVASVARIVLLPVLFGVILRRLFGRGLDPLLRIFPWVAMLAIVFVIAIIMALNRRVVLDFPLLLMLAVCLHNLLGLVAGYLTGRLLRVGEGERRALAIEVGMQNSGLAVALATQFFAPLSALPGALFSLWHNVSGILLANWWRQLAEPGSAASSG